MGTHDRERQQCLKYSLLSDHPLMARIVSVVIYAIWTIHICVSVPLVALKKVDFQKWHHLTL